MNDQQQMAGGPVALGVGQTLRSCSVANSQPNVQSFAFHSNGPAPQFAMHSLNLNPCVSNSHSHAHDNNQNRQDMLFTSTPNIRLVVAAAAATHRTPPPQPQQVPRPLNGHSGGAATAGYRRALASSSSLPDGSLLTRGGFVLAECDAFDIDAPPAAAGPSMSMAHSQTFGDRLELADAAGDSLGPLPPSGPGPESAADLTQYYRSQTTPATQQLFPAEGSFTGNELRAVLAENMTLKQKLSSLEHENLFLLEKLRALTTQFSAVQNDLERLRRRYPEQQSDTLNSYRFPSHQTDGPSASASASAASPPPLATSAQSNEQNRATAMQYASGSLVSPPSVSSRSPTHYSSSTHIEQCSLQTQSQLVASTSRMPPAAASGDSRSPPGAQSQSQQQQQQQNHRHTVHLDSPTLEGGADASASLVSFKSPLGSRTPELSRAMRATSSSPLHRGASLRGLSSPPPLVRPVAPNAPADLTSLSPTVAAGAQPVPPESQPVLAGPPAAAAVASPLSRLRNNKPFAEWSINNCPFFIIFFPKVLDATMLHFWCN